MEAVLKVRPIGDKNGPFLEEAFKDACIHFSHFMDPADYKVIELHQVYKLLLRGAALSCRQNQRSVDFLTPILFGPPDWTSISSSVSSALQAQIKNRNDSEDIIIPPTLVNSENDHPVLSIIHELGGGKQGVKCTELEELGTTQSGSDPDWRHYQIVAYGCSSETYRVIPKDSDAAYTMLLGSNMLMEVFPRGDIPECAAMFKQSNPCSELEHTGARVCQWFGKDVK